MRSPPLQDALASLCPSLDGSAGPQPTHAHMHGWGAAGSSGSSVHPRLRAGKGAAKAADGGEWDSASCMSASAVARLLREGQARVMIQCCATVAVLCGTASDEGALDPLGHLLSVGIIDRVPVNLLQSALWTEK